MENTKDLISNSNEQPKRQTLKEKCEAMKASTNYIIEPDTYVVLHLDGRSFSTRVKKAFKRPFDEKFVHAMDETMKYLVENIQGALIGYAQSDEINIILSDKTGDPEVHASPFFNYRLNKMQSICASMCGAKFNRIMFEYLLDNAFKITADIEEYKGIVDEMCENAPLYSFDCKAFPAKDINDAYAWLLYRQHDCVRNSRAQVAQYYLPHKALVGLTSDRQIALLKEQKGIDWNADFRDGLKYGRYCVYKTKTVAGTDFMGSPVEYMRNYWDIEEGRPADTDGFKEYLMANIGRRENYRTYE